MAADTRHPAARAADIEWRPVNEPPHGRVISATAARSDPHVAARGSVRYELLAGGGQRWIRRVIRKNGTDHIHDTPHQRASVINALWPRVIAGSPLASYLDDAS